MRKHREHTGRRQPGEMEAEIEGMLPQAKGLLGPPETRKKQRKIPSLQGSEIGPGGILI